MSRGLGNAQRLILQRLASHMPPLPAGGGKGNRPVGVLDSSWTSLAELGLPPEQRPRRPAKGKTLAGTARDLKRTQAAAYRRAVRALAARGLVECTTATVDVDPHRRISWSGLRRPVLHLRLTAAGRAYYGDRLQSDATAGRSRTAGPRAGV